MPAERLSMRKVREVLRLKYACGASERVIARSVGIGRTAIGRTTIDVLLINLELRVTHRQLLLDAGLFPLQ